MSVRNWVSVATLVFIALIVFFSRHELMLAWRLLEQVNLWILALVIPVQIMSYFAAGEMMFSYLRSKNATSRIAPLKQVVMALEMNFVNHTLPSAGVSGISYMTWRLGHYGITPARAAVAQLVRYVAGFASFVVLLVVALIFITLDGNISRGILLLSGLMISFMTGGTLLLMYIVGSRLRIEWFARWATRFINKVVRMLTFGRKQSFVQRDTIVGFFGEMHEEYLVLRRESRLLLKPFLWGLVFNSLDVAIFVITFWALGSFVSPAPILIAYGIASIAGFIVVTPGGAGAYEAIMVSFLASAGILPGVAIAGILLARIAILLGTIGFGYAFYQHTLVKYGKSKSAL